MPKPTPQLITGLSEIAGDYDALICDVWGVLHNGKEAKPSAWEACKHFHQLGRPVILFSNAPRVASEVHNQLGRLGVPQAAYDAIITSGEVTRAELASRSTAQSLQLFHIGPERDRSVYEGLNISLVDLAHAQLVLCTGLFDDENETPEDYRGLLAQAKARGLSLVCVNPDIVVQRGAKLIYCAGAIARLYEEMGGQMIFYGKPHRPIFDAAIARAREFGKADRPLVVGDGLETDIKGANAAAMDALFIMDGIYSDEIPDKTDAAAIARLLNAKGVTARAAMPVLAW